MTTTIRALLDKLQELDQELEADLARHRREFHYTVREKRVRFEAAVEQHHRELRKSWVRFIRDSELPALLVSPLIYMQIVPLVLLDIAVSLFHAIAFPVYGIDKVPRSDFIVVDRHHLQYLNGIERLNCAYCGYANGLLAWTREIAGRTEAYWCPIKHARRTAGQHRRYYDFAEYGDADGYRQVNRHKPSKK
jgi:hypothetical protein